MITFIDDYGYVGKPRKGDAAGVARFNKEMDERGQDDLGHWVLLSDVKQYCAHCRKVGELTGHMGCEYPQNW